RDVPMRPTILLELQNRRIPLRVNQPLFVETLNQPRHATLAPHVAKRFLRTVKTRRINRQRQHRALPPIRHRLLKLQSQTHVQRRATTRTKTTPATLRVTPQRHQAALRVRARPAYSCNQPHISNTSAGSIATANARCSPSCGGNTAAKPKT